MFIDKYIRDMKRLRGSRKTASEGVLCVLGIKLMFQSLWLALVAL